MNWLKEEEEEEEDNDDDDDDPRGWLYIGTHLIGWTAVRTTFRMEVKMGKRCDNKIKTFCS